MYGADRKGSGQRKLNKENRIKEMNKRNRIKGEQKKLKINVEFWIIPLIKSINFDSIYFKFQKSSV